MADMQALYKLNHPLKQAQSTAPIAYLLSCKTP